MRSHYAAILRGTGRRTYKQYATSPSSGTQMKTRLRFRRMMYVSDMLPPLIISNLTFDSPTLVTLNEITLINLP